VHQRGITLGDRVVCGFRNAFQLSERHHGEMISDGQQSEALWHLMPRSAQRPHCVRVSANQDAAASQTASATCGLKGLGWAETANKNGRRSEGIGVHGGAHIPWDEGDGSTTLAFARVIEVSYLADTSYGLGSPFEALSFASKKAIEARSRSSLSRADIAKLE